MWGSRLLLAVQIFPTGYALRFRESQMGHFQTVYKCLFARLANLRYPDVVFARFYVRPFAGITASSLGAVGSPPD